MRALIPSLTVVVIAVAAIAFAIYRADHPPKQVPTAPNEIVHIADWHWVR